MKLYVDSPLFSIQCSKEIKNISTKKKRENERGKKETTLSIRSNSKHSKCFHQMQLRTWRFKNFHRASRARNRSAPILRNSKNLEEQTHEVRGEGWPLVHFLPSTCTFYPCLYCPGGLRERENGSENGGERVSNMKLCIAIPYKGEAGKSFDPKLETVYAGRV